MNKTLTTSLIALAATLSANALTIGVDAGLNITNDGSSLVTFVPQFSPQNPATHYDWLTPGGTFDPGQIVQYNDITGSSLPQPISSDPAYLSETSPENGEFMFDVGNYYITAHFGRFNAAWYLNVTDASEMYGIIEDINGTGPGNGGGGYSNFRAWRTTDSTTSVPETGATLALLGLAVSAIGILRRRVR